MYSVNLRKVAISFKIFVEVFFQIFLFLPFTNKFLCFKMHVKEGEYMRKGIRTKTLEEGEIIPITFDYVFCNIFNNEENIIILENFLACYLEVPLEKIRGHVELLNRNLGFEHKKEANKQIDLLVDIEGEKINIELQNKMSEGIINRNVVFACKVHAGQLKLRKEMEKRGSYNRYNAIKKTLQINLTRNTNERHVKESYYLTNEKGKILTEKLQIDLVDMEMAKKICYTKSESKLSRWCTAFLATTEEEFEKALGEDLMEEEAKELLTEEVTKYSREEEVVEMYSEYSREELERQSVFEERLEKETKKAIAKGLEQGITQGIEQNRIEIAKNMIEDHMDIEDIMRYTKLSMEEIEKLR